jgi:uroporphyrin-III C-methyltransferase/precorrin-2 dehydrogenase/sirohydrochlorin ferrochelatase
MTRSPAEIRTTRIGTLARLPAFFALENKRAVVAGGSQAATWKAELLSATGARVEVFAAAPSEEMLALAAAPPRGPVILQNRTWAPDDLTGAAIAVADCADDEEAAQFAAAPSSIARRWLSAFRPMAPRRCSARRSAPRLKR